MPMTKGCLNNLFNVLSNFKMNGMSELQKSQVKLDIELLINRSRFGGENFFTDSKSAADQILAYLQQINLLVKDEGEGLQHHN